MAGGDWKRSGFTLGAMLVAVVALIAVACGGSSEGSPREAPATDTPASAAAPTEPMAAAPTATEPIAAPTAAEPTAAGPMDGPSSAPSTRIELEARDNVFNVQPSQGAPGTIEAPANTEITVKLVNEGVLPHNIAFFREQGGSLLDEDAIGDIILEAETDSVTFTTPGPGTYFFVCTVHPQEMFGDFIVN